MTLNLDLNELKMGRAQRFQNITVFPLLAEIQPKLNYLALDTAMDRNLVEITEVSESGSVPNLAVHNRADLPVLIVDGEEVLGAKQNRVVNTSILLPAKSSTTIPVSCTEQGRWNKVSHCFSKSDTVLYAKARAKKAKAVSHNYKVNDIPASNQNVVWKEIHDLECKANFKSPSSAMNDVFKAQKQSLDECLKSIRPIEDQRGLLVCVDGKPLGCDYVSRPEVYERLHNKLVRSYVIDALLEKKAGKAARKDSARAFLKRSSACKGHSHQSPGQGTDVRLEGKHLSGTALVQNGEVIHQACFVVEDDHAPRQLRNREARIRRPRWMDDYLS